MPHTRGHTPCLTYMRGGFKPQNHKKKPKDRKYDGDFKYTGDTLEVNREGKSRATPRSVLLIITP